MNIFTNRAIHALLHVLCKVAPTDDLTRRAANIAADFKRFTRADISAIFCELDIETLHRVYKKLLKNKCINAPWCICETCMLCQDAADLQL